MQDKKNIQTIYYQGLYSSQIEIAKYTEYYDTTTNERVRCKKYLDVIHNPYIGDEIDEIKPKKIIRTRTCFDGVANWFSKSFDFFYQLTKRRNKNDKLVVEQLDKNNKYTLEGHNIILKKVSMAQDNDVNNHKKKYEKCLQEHPETDLILWGFSRGAATTFNAIVHNDYDLSKIKLVVLEGCFDNFENVLEKEHYFNNFMSWLATKLTKYKKNHKMCPACTADQFPKDVPIAFITSKKDETISYKLTMNLVNKLIEHGHKNVHYLILENSSHRKYIFDNEEDRQKYYNFIQSLYLLYDCNFQTKMNEV